jgi:hypothetical protein
MDVVQMSRQLRTNSAAGVSGGAMTASIPTSRSEPLTCSCGFYDSASAHHDRLLTVERDMGALIDLFDLAVTWGELDYSEQRLVTPPRWPAFVSAHPWRDVERATQIFQLASDVALHSTRAGTRESGIR